MLAKPTKAITEVLTRFENKTFTCEYKYDGERAQVHLLPDGKVAIFSRNSEDMSKKYPDLVEQIPRCIKEGTTSFVLDAEAVAINKTTGALLPFQELSKRKRKDVKVEDIQVKVALYAFDLLYLNGEVSATSWSSNYSLTSLASRYCNIPSPNEENFSVMRSPPLQTNSPSQTPPTHRRLRISPSSWRFQ